MLEEGPYKVLIIEDEQTVRISMAAYLEDSGYVIDEAENGDVGLKVFKPEIHDIVLVDLRMPEVDGLEVLSRMTSNHSETPVIVVSGNGDISDVVHALRLGAWDYILKPIEDMAVLEYSIEKSLERSRLIKENKAYQNHLEELVEKRTKELEQVNNELKSINSRLKGIVNTTHFLSSLTRSADFGTLFLEEISKNMSIHEGSFYLAGEKDFQLIHSLGNAKISEWITITGNNSKIIHNIIEDKKTILVEDRYLLEELQHIGVIKRIGDPQLVVPILSKDATLLGLVFLSWTGSDLEIGEILASYCSEALQTVLGIEKLKKSLEEKEILLQEVHHRVKNNLQVISSLIYLQHQKIGDTKVKKYLQTTENRVRAMAFIHEQLYQFKDFSRIEYAAYIRELIEYLYDSYKLDHAQVEIAMDIENLYLNLSTSIPLGLLINEIISNTFKYAFPDKRTGRIDITLKEQEDNHYLLEIADDGIGIPESVSLETTESLGMKLIEALVNQLEGEMELKRDKGTAYRVIFSAI